MGDWISEPPLELDLYLEIAIFFLSNTSATRRVEREPQGPDIRAWDLQEGMANSAASSPSHFYNSVVEMFFKGMVVTQAEQKMVVAIRRNCSFTGLMVCGFDRERLQRQPNKAT